MTNRSLGHGHRILGICVVLLGSGCSLGHHASSTMVGPGIHGVVVSRSTGGAIQNGAPIVIFARPQRVQPIPRTAPLHMRRQQESFVPSFLVVMAGQQVRFENVDSLCHNVFSTSEQNAFETGLLQPGTAKVVRFDRPGAVHLYCSLHKKKQATLLVVPTPHFAIVRPTGEFEIGGLTPGRYDIVTWSRDKVLHRARIDIAGDPRFVKIAVPEEGVQEH